MTTNMRDASVKAALAISATLLFGACSSDNSSATTRSLEGQASKGIVIGGLVNAYALTDTSKSTPLAEPATTAADGSYELVLNSAYVPGTALLVEITATTGTQMKCDLPSCATGVNFGDLYDLPAGFAMSAALPSASGTVTTNVTPLTHAAAQTAAARVSAGASASEAALAANAQLADRLGISGSLVDQPIVDITNADDVNAADQDALEYNLKAAGVIAALQADNAGSALEDLVDTFANQFSGGGLAETETTETASVTLEELLEASLSILDEVKQLEGVNQSEGSAVAQTETEVTSEESAAASGSTEPSQGEVPEDVQDAGLSAAKAFGRQLRNLANAASLPTANQDLFADEIGLATGVIDENIDPVAEGLGIAMAAIADAANQVIAARDDDDPGTTPPSSTQFEGVTVTITENAGTYTYDVAQDLGVEVAEEQADGTVLVTTVTVALDLTASDASSIDGTYTESTSGSTYSYSDEATIDGDLSIMGSASTDAVSLAVNNGSQIQALFELSESGTETQTDTAVSGSGSDSDEGSVTLAGVDAALIVELTQKSAAVQGGPTFTFTGSMGLEVDLATLDFTGANQWSYDQNGYSGSGDFEDSFTIGSLSLSLGGTIASSAGESLALNAAIVLSNVDVTCTASDSYSYSNSTQQYSESSSDGCVENTGAADASISVIFEADLAGIDDDVTVNLSAARTGLRTGNVDLDLSYGGSQLNLDYSHPDTEAAGFDGTLELTVTNHNGVEMVLTAENVDSETAATTVAGVINSGGKKQADVEETSEGVVLIRYIDGTTESII